MSMTNQAVIVNMQRTQQGKWIEIYRIWWYHGLSVSDRTTIA